MDQREMEMWKAYRTVRDILDSRGITSSSGFYCYIPGEGEKILLVHLIDDGVEEREASAPVTDLIKDPENAAESLILQHTFS
jgi:hypothetical protein